MNDLQIFQNKQFGQVRTIVIKNEPYFVGKDVADILKYQNGSRDINRHVDEEDRTKIMLSDGSQSKETIAINESGLYSLILSSKMPEAKKFKHWVTSEVLPAIRKTGSYTAKFAIPKTLSEALQLAADQAKQIETDKPKVLFAESVQVTKNTILIRELAKLISQNGYQIGEKRLFDWLRSRGYLIKKIGNDYNKPTQRAMEMGLFKVTEHAITHSDGVQTHTTPKVTGKGQVYFINKFLREERQVQKAILQPAQN